MVYISLLLDLLLSEAQNKQKTEKEETTRNPNPFCSRILNAVNSCVRGRQKPQRRGAVEWVSSAPTFSPRRRTRHVECRCGDFVESDSTPLLQHSQKGKQTES